MTQETATDAEDPGPALLADFKSTYTLIFLSHTLRLKDLYIQIRSCGPSLPISLSVSLTGSAEIPGTRCQPPPCFHLRSPTQHPSRRSLSLTLFLLRALRSCGLCPAAHCSLHARVWGGSEGRVGLDRFLELLYDKSGLSSACLQHIRSKPSHFEQYQTNCLL